ncbi:hypothetical protein Acy02nite_90140 [Actinoplanes cyaneus]|uniref:NACHT domain-containing protein n=1 Tax=Actinoplanes cyaneus TaxID=52696 RepID=A0A919ITI1_9ACTN|nr:NACHT domain-containing protein [Actinoplanes cyaneus]MCW2144376.1 NACHT domain-containing protein [Actinoplanes cyaneus]GID71133.1 hypothetical protein Acy02nite_90140 [Actinoplanes cyaneus]
MGHLRFRPGPARLALLTALAAGALALVGNLATNTVEVTWKWWSVAVWTGTGLLLLVTAWLAVLAVRSAGNQDTVAEAERRLREAVRKQWTQSAVLHSLRQPLPLRLRWSSTQRNVAAARPVVDPKSALPDWRTMPFAGDAEDVAARFLSLPHRQLVVLGEPGAGKTVLAILLTLGLLDDQAAGAPVPVLIPVNSWNPDAEVPEDFVFRRLLADHPFLAGHDSDPRTLIARLAAQRRLVVVLDGLDELDPDLHVTAIRQLDKLAVANWQLVVTCRTQEYEVAVNLGGAILSRAAVVEIASVSVDDAIAFLSHPEPLRHRWDEVFGALRESPRGDLATVLSTPLMVSLARTAYAQPATNPRELLDLPTTALISATLFDTFVASLYPVDARSHSWAQAAPARRHYDGGRAKNWLRFMAFLLTRRGSRDLRWQLLDAGALSRRPDRAEWLLRAVTAVLGGVLAGMAGWFVSGPIAALIAGSASAAVVLGTARGVWGSLGSAPARGDPRSWMRYSGRWVGYVSLVGLVVAAISGHVAAGFAAGIASGILLLGAIAPRWFRRRRAGPAPERRTLWIVADTSARHALIGVLGFVATLLVRHDPFTWAGSATALVVCGCSAALAAGGWWWVRFRLAHLSFVVRSRLPLQLLAFIRDGYERNVFRRNAGVWQFRHALLQDHLGLDFRLVTLRKAAASDESARWDLAELLRRNGRLPELRELAAAGNQAAEYHLAEVLLRAGDVAAARVLLEKLAARDVADSVGRLADLCLQSGDSARAISLLRDQIRRGGPTAVVQLAGILARLGSVDEAVELMSGDLARQADPEARGLVRLLVEHDRTVALRRLAHAGNWRAAYGLGQILVRKGVWPEAISLGLKHAAGASIDMVVWLADLLALDDRLDEALALLESRPDDWQARHRLEILLVSNARFDELADRAAAGDSGAALALASLPAHLPRAEDGLRLLERRSDAGDAKAAAELAYLLGRRGETDRLRERAAAGDQSSAVELAKSLDRDGRRAEATRVLRRVAARGSFNAVITLAEILADTGHAQEAVIMVRPYADGGNKDAILGLAHHLAKDGRLDEAIDRLQLPADEGDEDAARQLTDLLVQGHRLRQLEHRADAGDRFAGRALAAVLVAGEDEPALRARARAGDRESVLQLAGLLSRRGAVDEALALLAPLTGADDDAAAPRAAILRKHGRTIELGAWVRQGDRAAGRALAEEYAAQGRIAAATSVLGPQAAGGDRESALQLAELLAGIGQVDETVARLEPYLRMGDLRAGSVLAEALASNGRMDRLAVRAERGDQHAIIALGGFLIEQGRLSAAATFLRTHSQPEDSIIARRLAQIHARNGDTAAGLACLRPHRHDPYICDELADLLTASGRTDEALRILRRQATAGNRLASRQLAVLLAKLDLIEELRGRATGGDGEAAIVLAARPETEVANAIRLLQPYQDDRHAVRDLADLLIAQGDVDQAVSVVRRHTAIDPAGSEYYFIDLLRKHGRVNELGTRAAGGDSLAAVVLAKIRTDRGEVASAIELLRPFAGSGNDAARAQLAALLDMTDEAELRARAGRGDDRAARRLSDLLLGQGRAEHAIELLREHSGGRNEHTLRLAVLLRRQNNASQAFALLRAPAAAGDWAIGRPLVQMLRADDRLPEASDVVQPFVARTSGACVVLADLLFAQGASEQAVSLLEQHAPADRDASRRLVAVLTAGGRVDEALAVLRTTTESRQSAQDLPALLKTLNRRSELETLAAEGNSEAAGILVEMMAADGELDEAIALAGRFDHASRVNGSSFGTLADELAGRGRLAEAMRLLREAPPNSYLDDKLVSLLVRDGDLEMLRSRHAEDPLAARALATLLRDQGDGVGAASVLRVHASADTDTAIMLADLLADGDQVDEAIAVLQPGAISSTRSTKYALIDLLTKHERVEELRAWCGQGDTDACGALADVLVRREETGEATQILHGPAQDDVSSALRLAAILTKSGDVASAVAVLHRFAWSDESAATRLAELLVEQADVAGAIAVLTPHAMSRWDYGSPRLLVDLLAREGDVAQLQLLATAGDGAAARRLARLLTDRNEGGRAMAVLATRSEVDAEAAIQLAGLYLNAHREADAEAVLRAHAAVDAEAAVRLAKILASSDEAVRVLMPHARHWSAGRELVALLAGQRHLPGLRAQVDRGNSHAAMALASLLIDDPATVDEALDLARRAVADGVFRADIELVNLLVKAGRDEELRALAAGGDAHAADVLARILEDRGETDQAIVVLRAVAEQHASAAVRLAALLDSHSRTDEAVAVLTPHTNRDDYFASAALAKLLTAHERIADLQAQAIRGDGHAVRALADLLVNRGSLDDAVEGLWPLAAGDAHVACLLTRLLTDHDAKDEAIALLSTHAPRSAEAAVQFAELLVDRGEVDEAIAALAPHATADPGLAGHRLVELLEREKRVDQLRELARTGSDYAAQRLAGLLLGLGAAEHHSEIIALLRPFAGTDVALDRRLAGVLASQGLTEDAETTLRPHLDDPTATAQLAKMLAGRGENDEAIRMLTPHAEHWEAGDDLIKLLILQRRRADLEALAASGNARAARALAAYPE